jgi:hypothetical protein
MAVIIHNNTSSEHIEITKTNCFELEAKLNASRYVDRWSDLGDKLYQAGSGNLDMISVPQHQYEFLKEELLTKMPKKEDVRSLRKLAFDEEEYLPLDRVVRERPKDIPQYGSGRDIKHMVAFFVPMGGSRFGIVPLKM